MEGKNPKGFHVKGVTIKRVPRGTLPPPPEVIRTDVSAVVTQMFSPRVKKEVKVKKPIIIKEELEGKVEVDEDEGRDPEYKEAAVVAPSGYEGVPPELLALESSIKEKEADDVYTLKPKEIYTPEISKHFTKYITTTFSDFALPPRIGPVNYELCSNMEFKTYKYQEFIREYMRSASPYRGTLVYHGLGSGKTCTSIATAEALYGTTSKKIIVMTPISLQENFLTEISSCGFQHFRTNNFWVSFSLTDPVQKLFAQEIVGIPQAYIASVIRKAKPQERVFWMPDFSKPSNYDELEASQQTAIKAQIRVILQNRIRFIGYTGITHDELKQIACDKPDYFDDAVIIIDEVHNLTRLMRGKLDKYLKNVLQPQVQQQGKKPKKIPFSYEPMTTETWKPKLCGSSQKYDRAFLIYRLLAQAKRSKIIALSGTPIVNFPEEVGILCNILHGYFHSAEDNLMSIQNADIQSLERILKLHPRVQYYNLRKAEGYTIMYFTKLEDHYMKQFVGEVLQGVIHTEEDEKSSTTVQEIYQEILKEAKDAGLKFNGRPLFKATPLFPETIEEFTTYFVDTTSLHIKNPILFKKRITGLVSYYKGAKEELMPKVVKDEVVFVPMSTYALGPYAEARQKEREEKTEAKQETTWEELNNLAQSEGSSASYRFRSRAACNFVFPKGIPRPFPSNRREMNQAAKVEDIVLGDTAVDEETVDAQNDDAASQVVQEEEEEDEEEQLETSAAIIADDMRVPYGERVAAALTALRAVATRRFKLDPSAPEEEQLKTYSGKFEAIMQRIEQSSGSSLVYSQFKTLEGIGILSIVMETNGYAPLSLVGSDDSLSFSPETEKSLRENPGQPRYIIYSGEQTKRVRQTLINIFNTKLTALPEKIANVLTQIGLVDPVTRKGNLKGEVCKVFMITGAGAEGLSLRNVRTVHIMEPYWNTVRTEQVKGRAVRICSHSDLPYSPDPALNQRTVEIFTYISKISDAMKKARTIDQTLITIDDGKTTDEHIYEISRAKEQVSHDFLQAMKEGSVDCLLNQSENERISCFMYDGPIEEFIYDPRINYDKDMTDIHSKQIVATAQPAMQGTIVPAPTTPAPTAPQQEGTKYPLIAYQKKFYVKVPKGDYFGLYAATDMLLTKEVGKIVTVDGKQKVQLYGP